jgi:two-component system OmpR family response regulator
MPIFYLALRLIPEGFRSHIGWIRMPPEHHQMNTRPQILLIEGDIQTAQQVSLALEDRGYDVWLKNSLSQLSESVRMIAPSMILMERVLRGTDSLPMLETWRSEGNNVPVLILSAMSSVSERIRGFKAGADGYLTKPYSVGELVARVEALHRRLNEARTSLLRVGPLTMDFIEHAVRRDDRDIELRSREFELLEYFMRRPNQVLTRDMLLRDVWEPDTKSKVNLIDVQVGNLRRKVDAAGEAPLIKTVRGAGFMLYGRSPVTV